MASVRPVWIFWILGCIWHPPLSDSQGSRRRRRGVRTVSLASPVLLRRVSPVESPWAPAKHYSAGADRSGGKWSDVTTRRRRRQTGPRIWNRRSGIALRVSRPRPRQSRPSRSSPHGSRSIAEGSALVKTTTKRSSCQQRSPSLLMGDWCGRHGAVRACSRPATSASGFPNRCICSAVSGW